MKTKVINCIICNTPFHSLTRNYCAACDDYHKAIKKENSTIRQIMSLAYERGKFGFYYKTQVKLKNVGITIQNFVDYGLLQEIDNQYIITENGIRLYNYIFGDKNERESSS